MAHRIGAWTARWRGRVAGLALLLAVALPRTAAAELAVVAGTTSLTFSETILADLGITSSDVVESSTALREGGLGFALDGAGASLAAFATGIDFEGFASGEASHAGGLTLTVAGVAIDLSGFRLGATGDPHELALRDADATTWLRVVRPQSLRSGDRVTIRNADLVLSSTFAALLGRPDLAGSYVGVLDAELELEASASTQGAVACAGDFSQPVDVVMLDLLGMTQNAREPGGRIAMAPGASLGNLGPGDVEWYRAIAPDGVVGPHPYLSLAFYRLSNGVLEQIGLADVKHAFFAVNSNCPCPGDQILYAGCEDFYGAFTNLNRTYLAPREEVDAFQRTWTSQLSHFDGPNGDDVRSHDEIDHDAYEHRLVVMEPDLQTPGARYFYDGWYLAARDTNLQNSMGWREVAPSLGGSTWSFPTIDGGMQNGSVLDAWVDPVSPPAGTDSELLDTGEGRVQLAVMTSETLPDVYHYEYALMNFDFEREVRRFAVPVAPGQTVTNAAFGDGNADPLDDWTVTVAATEVVFEAPAGAELGWGRLYNFRMDVDGAPVPSHAELEPLAAGGPSSVTIATLAPTALVVPMAPPWALGTLLAGVAGAGIALSRGRRRS